MVSVDDTVAKGKCLKLEEKDIPGAELPKPAEQCTVAILKHWLIFRGLN